MDVYWMFLLLSAAPLIALAVGYGALQIIKWIIDNNLQKR